MSIAEITHVFRKKIIRHLVWWNCWQNGIRRNTEHWSGKNV